MNNIVGTKEAVQNAWRAGIVVPAFNIPYLPMMAPVVEALAETDTFGLIQVARLEWEKFESDSLAAICEEYDKTRHARVTRLHLDHVPVIDEDDKRVDYKALIAEAIDLGYESVMVDGSRLALEENIACTRAVVEMAHAAGIPAEAELGAVLGHESGPLPPYDELFASGRGFTRPEEAKRFVAETGVDWLSVSIGNVHGAISGAARSGKKVQARLDIAHLDRIHALAGVPLVLHGGSGILKECLLDAFRHGIAKINIGTTIRQVYESACSESAVAADRAVHNSVKRLVVRELEIAGTAGIVLGARQAKEDKL